MEIRTYKPSDQESVLALWQKCNLIVPWNDPSKDIRRKLSDSPDQFLVGLESGGIVATIMFGYDGHRGSVNYLAVSPDHRGKGLGRQMMKAMESSLKNSGCPKINLMVRNTNCDVIQFYRSIGYVSDPVVVMSRRLESDE